MDEKNICEDKSETLKSDENKNSSSVEVMPIKNVEPCEEKTKKPRSGIVSTVIISVLIAISLIIMIFIGPITIEDITTPPGEDVSAIVSIFWVILVAGLGVASLYLWSIFAMVTHIICMIFTIFNLKVQKKSVKITNIVLCVLNGIIIIFAILKLIFLSC